MLNRGQVQEMRRAINSRLDVISETICPDDKIRLKFLVMPHFCERLEERFVYPYLQEFLREIYKWVDDDYCMNLYLINRGSYKINQEVHLKNGVLVVTFFENQIILKTCYTEKGKYP